MILIGLLLFGAIADRIAAQVGDEIILESEVREVAQFLSNDPMAQRTFANFDEIRSSVLEEMIARKLLLAKAEVESIVVADEEVEAATQRQLQEIKSRFPSEADFFKALGEQNITIEELKDNYQKNLKTQLIMQRLIEKRLAGKIMISPTAVKEFYDKNKDSLGIVPGRVKLSHILLAIRPSEDELKKGFEKTLEVYNLLRSGGDFGVIAQEFSEDENSRHRGGMLGKIKRGETLEEFERVVFNLKPGTLSEPFPTRLGYHIVEVLNKGADWVLLRQILFKVTVAKSDSLRYQRLAESLCHQINQGEDFDAIARKYSDDPDVDLGEFYINQLTPPFDEVVKDLEEGQISKPLLTPYGYHLIYVRRKIAGQVLSFEEIRDQIYQYLYQKRLQELYEKLIAEYKEETHVEIMPAKLQ